MNVASSVFWIFISSRKAPWYCLVCYAQTIITITRVLLKLSSLSAKPYTVDCYLLLLYSQYCYGESSKLLLFILFRDTPKEVHYVLLSIEKRQLSYIFMFYIKLSWRLVFNSQTSNLFFVVFLTQLFTSVKEIHKLRFLSTTTCADTKLLLLQTRKHWKMDQYQGLVGCSEVDLESDLNHPASGNLRQFTTVPSQCEQFPWTWTWRLLYLDCWYRFENIPGNV